MDTAAFLNQVVTTPEGYFNLLVGPPDDKDSWHDEWFEWPKQLPDIITRSHEAMLANNVYFTAHLYKHKHSTKDNVLSSCTIQADLDDAVLPTINQPTITVETSPARHQGYWILQDSLPPTELEHLSKMITYSIPDSDHSGWSLGHKMRMPDTLNHKYTSPKFVKVISATDHIYRDLKLPNLKQLEAIVSLPHDEEEWIPNLTGLPGPRMLWAQYRNNLPRTVVSQYDKVQHDGEGRSGALWALELALFRAGATRDEIFLICQHSANNKFKDNTYHADLDLAKDIIRAERSLNVGGNSEDIRSRIQEARHTPGSLDERRLYIASLVRDSMQQSGTFMATDDNQQWFVRGDTGLPISMSLHNGDLNSFLEIRYGLNPTEPEQRYTIHSLIATTKERGAQGHTASLSCYDGSNNTLLLHTGRKDVLYVTPTSISTVSNGDLGVLFPWGTSLDSFDPDFKHPLSINNLFTNCFDNLDELSPTQALALFKAWLMFLLFRNDAIGKPILALFGQPGSGKSTLFRRIYTFLYGPNKAVNSITNPDDFDHAVSHDPLVVFDNVDTWVAWLPDKLALSAANSDLVKRKLYTDQDNITLKRQALIGITAHNPKFRREDIVDRLLMLNFHRLSNFGSETDMLNIITSNRDAMWGQLLLDAQRVMSTPKPNQSEVPNFRVSDFARIGLWTARALGFEEDFVQAIKVNAIEQVQFNLEEEDILINILKSWSRRPSFDQEAWLTSGNLWKQLSILEDINGQTDFVRFYKNAITLGKKLFTLQETLKSVFDIEYRMDEKQGIRQWRIRPK